MRHLDASSSGARGPRGQRARARTSASAQPWMNAGSSFDFSLLFQSGLNPPLIRPNPSQSELIRLMAKKIKKRGCSAGTMQTGIRPGKNGDRMNRIRGGSNRTSPMVTRGSCAYRLFHPVNPVHPVKILRFNFMELPEITAANALRFFCQRPSCQSWNWLPRRLAYKKPYWRGGSFWGTACLRRTANFGRPPSVGTFTSPSIKGRA
jgi:hypothetical protein